MCSSSCCPSSRMTTIKTWAIMPLRPWGRRAYSVWFRYVFSSSFLRSFPLLSCSNISLWLLLGVVMMKGLMGRCMSHETMITCLREKVEAKDSELRELTAWKDVQISKLDYTKQLLKESEAQVKALKKILKDKEVDLGGKASPPLG